MNQTRLESLAEAGINILIGYTIALISQMVIFPQYGVTDMSFGDHIQIGFWFTLVSLVRSYTIRRWFNAGLHRAAVRLARGFIAP